MKRIILFTLLATALLLMVVGCGQAGGSGSTSVGIYLEKAQEYIDSGDYQSAKTLLEEGLKSVSSKEMEELLDTVKVLSSVSAPRETDAPSTPEPTAAPSSSGTSTPAATPSSVPTPTPTPAPKGPGEHDLEGVDSRIVRPNHYLSDYMTRYVRSSRGGGIYLRYGPSEQTDRIQIIDDDTAVTVLAEQDGFSLVIAPGQSYGWCKSKLLETEPYTTDLNGTPGKYDPLNFLGTWYSGDGHVLELTRGETYRDGYFDVRISYYGHNGFETILTYKVLYDAGKEGFLLYQGTLTEYQDNKVVNQEGTDSGFLTIRSSGKLSCTEGVLHGWTFTR